MIFDSRPIIDSRPIAFLKKAIVACAIAFLVIGIISSHRAYYQVRSVEVTSADHTLRSGSVIRTSIVSSGRTHADLQLELVQSQHTETLLMKRVHGNEFGFFDPRTQHASATIVVTPEVLARFQPGPATLRATGHGHSQWTRVPPPVVRELSVEIQTK